MGGDGNHIVQLEPPRVDGLYHQQQCHHLGHTGGLQLVVGVVLIEDGARLLLHQDGGPCLGLRSAGDGGGGQDQQTGA